MQFSQLVRDIDHISKKSRGMSQHHIAQTIDVKSSSQQKKNDDYSSRPKSVLSQHGSNYKKIIL